MPAHAKPPSQATHPPLSQAEAEQRRDFDVWLTLEQAQRLAAMEPARWNDWRRNLCCGDGRSGCGGSKPGSRKSK